MPAPTPSPTLAPTAVARRLAPVAASLALGTTLLACGASPPSVAPASLTQPSAEARSTPQSLGAYMDRVQALYADLWFAGRAGNQPLADYFVHELEETLEALADDHPTHDGHALTPHLTALLGDDGPLHALEQHLDGSDPDAFAAAYDRVGQVCTSCHAATGHRYLIVQRPTGPRSTNLRFEPVDAPR